MVSGFRLARRSEIVSRPPEKTRSTATADPLLTLSWLFRRIHMTYLECKGRLVPSGRGEDTEDDAPPPLEWITGAPVFWGACRLKILGNFIANSGLGPVLLGATVKLLLWGRIRMVRSDRRGGSRCKRSLRSVFCVKLGL